MIIGPQGPLRLPQRRSWMPIAAVTLGMALQRGFGALLPLVLAMVATRSGGFEAAGIVGVAAAAALLVAAAADLGISQAAVRDFAVASPGRREMFRLLRIKLSIGCIAALALAGGAYLNGSGTWSTPLVIAAIAIPPFSVTSLLTSKHAADGDGSVLAMGAIFGFAAGVITAVAIAVVSDDPAHLLVALAVARGVEAVLLAAGLRLPSFSSRGTYGVDWIARAWPLSVVGLLQIAYLRGQIIIPGAILSRHEAGQVVDGFNLYSAATLLPGALGLAAWPAIARAAATSPAAATRLALKFAAVNVALVSIPVGVLLAVPGPLASLVFGESSGALETYVRWGAFATLFIAPNAVLLSLALSMGRERIALLVWVGGLAASAVLTAVFSTQLGVAGAGFAVAASELVLLGLLWWCVSPAAGRGVRAALSEPRVAAILAGVGAGAAVGVLAQPLSFPTPATGYLPLLALPPLLAMTIWYTRYSLLAPASVFAVSWATALAVAQLPLFPTFGWNRETWLLLTVPPSVLALAALAGAGRSGWTPGWPPIRLRRPPVTAWASLACACLGALGWAFYFADIGTVPLFSDQIDIARFRPFSLPILLSTRIGYVAVAAAIPGLALSQSRNERVLFAAALLIGLVPMVASGGRLYPFSAVAIGLVAALLVTRLTLRVALVSLAGAVFLVAISSAIFFIRIEQQDDTGNEFKHHLNQELRPGRPDVLLWTIPVQMAASVSMYTLADLAHSRAFEQDDPPGLYSAKFIDRLIPAGDLEQVTRPTARFSLLTTTYIGPWFADFGFGGVVALSVAWGLAAGLLWRWFCLRPSPLVLLLYAYSAFWLMYAIYLNYWTVHGVWLADVAFLAILTAPAARILERARRWASRYENGASLETPETRREAPAPREQHGVSEVPQVQ
jgi:O-antigen/teichoic acid export membrane protein